MINWAILSIGVYIYVVSLMNVYRYAQTSANSLILKLIGNRRLVLAHILMLFCFCCLVLVPLNKEIMLESELKELYKNNSLLIYESIQNRGLIGIKTIPILTLIAGVIYIGAFF